MSINFINGLNNSINNETSLDKRDGDSVNKIYNIDLYQTHILLADDKKDLLYAFESLLKSDSYKNVMAFCDPKWVLKTFADMVKFKIAILGIHVPDINGLHL